MFRLCWRKQVIVPNIDVWPYIIIPCSSMYFCACLSKLLQAIFHFQAKYNEGCSRLLHITIDAVCSIMDIQSVCYSGATGCYTEFFPHHAFCGLVLLKWKTLKSDVKFVYSQKSEQKWKKLVMQKNTLSMTAIEEYCTQHILLWFLLLDSEATERGKNMWWMLRHAWCDVAFK